MEKAGQTVAVVGPFPPIKGGISHHSASVAGALEAAGLEVHRYSWSAQYPKRLYGREQIDRTAVPTDGVRWWLRWWDPLSWLRVARAVRSADAVFLPWVTPVHAIPQLVLAVASGNTRVLMHVHNALPHEPLPFSRFWAKRVLRRADLILCHAESLADDVNELARANVQVTPLPPTLMLEASPLPARVPIRLLFLGIVRHYKGADIAVEAVEILHRRGVQVELTVAGEMWDRPAALESDHVDGLAAAVTVIDKYLSDGEVASLIRDHHVLVAPYRTATQSAVVPLAFAAGRPVVGTTAGGLKDVLCDGVNATVCTPDDAEAFADAIERAIGTLDTLAAGATESAGSWDDYAQVVVAFLTGARRPTHR